MRCIFEGVLSLFFVLLLCTSLFAVDYGHRLGDREREFRPTGASVLSGALDPSLRKWYVPQELFAEYQWQQWTTTNYAKVRYRRYVDIDLEGECFYDLFGNLTTRGWLLYDWHQTQPRREGSSLLQTLWYLALFDRLVIASDARGEYHYALTIGDEIRTMLTPMTFAKPNFNGIQWDFLSDTYSLTVLLSRINSPGYGMNFGEIPDQTTDNTHLFGGRGTVRLGNAVEIGATYVNAHQSQTLTDFRAGPFEGMLSTGQNRDVSLVQIRLSDDSPEDGTGGAAFIDQEVWITDIHGSVIQGKDVGLLPELEGGKKGIAFLAADGNDRIILTYDLSSPSYTGPEPARIDHLHFRLLLANDYRVEVTSDRQANRSNRPVFLVIAKAPGNVKDNTNQRIVAFDYGLPVTNEVYGITLEVRDVAGFNVSGEFDVTRSTRKYPNVNLKHHHASTSDCFWRTTIGWR